MVSMLIHAVKIPQSLRAGFWCFVGSPALVRCAGFSGRLGAVGLGIRPEDSGERNQCPAPRAKPPWPDLTREDTKAHAGEALGPKSPRLSSWVRRPCCALGSARH